MPWQDYFAEPRLRQLIEAALANNRDLRVAVLNIEQARATFQVRRADMYPGVGLAAKASRAPATGTGDLTTARTAGFTVLDAFPSVESANSVKIQKHRLREMADALLAALNRGHPGMAAVDVFESEPILQGHALLRLENCICTPHIGYVEQDSYEMYFAAAFDNVVNFINGTPTNIVNPGALQVRR